ncbi:MAG TPA: hypothetical protein VGM54_13455 [Chthoniobacter sp.]|jgi:hypothetical protein
MNPMWHQTVWALGRVGAVLVALKAAAWVVMRVVQAFRDWQR